MFIITDKTSGRKVDGVGVTKGGEGKLEEIETSYTLGGSGEVTRGEERGERRECRSFSDVIHT